MRLNHGAPATGCREKSEPSAFAKKRTGTSRHRFARGPTDPDQGWGAETSRERTPITRIVLVQGHPDPGVRHFCHALADAYRSGAIAAGHGVRDVAVTDLQFPVLRSRAEWETQAPAPDVARAQELIGWAEHIVLVYPLWLGTMPALLKAFLEQVFRPGFAMGNAGEGKGWSRKLAGKSARIVVTMGMPALVYRWYFGAHGLKSLEQGILAIVGIKPSRHSLVGSIEAISARKRRGWLEAMRVLGHHAR